MTCDLSIIIPYVDDNHIDSVVQSIEKQSGIFSLSTVEIILVYNGSKNPKPNSFGPASLFARLRIIESPIKNNVSVARNVGAAVADGQFLLFLDSEVELATNFLSAGLMMLKEGGDVLQFPIFPIAEDINRPHPPFMHYFATRHQATEGTFCLLHRPYARPVVDSACFFIRRAFFEKLGGFNADLRRAEDRELSLRIRSAGAVLKFSLRSKCHKAVTESSVKYFFKELKDSYHLARLFKRSARPSLVENKKLYSEIFTIATNEFGDRFSLKTAFYFWTLHWLKFIVFYLFCQVGHVLASENKKTMVLGDKFSYLISEKEVRRLPFTNEGIDIDHLRLSLELSNV